MLHSSCLLYVYVPVQQFNNNTSVQNIDKYNIRNSKGTSNIKKKEVLGELVQIILNEIIDKNMY